MYFRIRYTEMLYNKYRDSDSRAPKGRKRRADALRIPMRISDQLKDMLDAEKEPRERYNDTIIRLLVKRTARIAELQKKVDGLLLEQGNYMVVPNK
jgi:hypothetical protein